MQYSSIIFVVVLIAAFYFLLIRPQQQQAKRQRQMVESLRPGTHIMTIGGIYATVVEIEEDRIRVAVADGSELEIARRAVASVLPAEGEDEGETEAADEAGTADEPKVAGTAGESSETDEAESDSADD